MAKFRKKSVVVEAVQFTGDNWAEMHEFTGHIEIPGNPLFDTFTELSDVAKQMFAEFNLTASVWDVLHNTWVYVFPGMWVIKGVRGEFYPCAPDVFAETYKAVE